MSTTKRTTVYRRSLGLPTGIPIGYYVSIDDVNLDAKDANAALNLVNLYLGQKGALVEGRDFLAEKVAELTKFPADPKKDKTVEVKDKAGKVTGTKVENSETEGEYLARVKSAIAAGTLKVEGVATTEDAALTWFQSLIDAHGPFNNDSAAAERAAGKAKAPPQYAINGATAIIAKGAGRIKAWKDTFTKNGVPFAPFDVVAPTDATVEAKAAVAQANITALAWAIKANEEAEAKNKYV